MGVLSELKPVKVWQYFEDICQVPRPSKQEAKMIQFLLDFAKKNNLNAKRDEIGNVLITKPATPGFEDRKTIVLQAHMDMVCEKNSDVVHDFSKDPIVPVIKGDWVYASGTTLGADDGIGVAAEMALLTADDIEHPAIECLFTVDEETGLSGAFAIQSGFFDGKILLNLDSEDEGEIFIGCAGGEDTLATFEYKKEKVPANHVAIRISVDGLKGGHSGDEINKGLGNSNKIINRFLMQAQSKFNIRLSNFDGGNMRNAIPREAFAVLTVEKGNAEILTSDFIAFGESIKQEIGLIETGIQFHVENVDAPEFVIDEPLQKRLFYAIAACPHGVHALSASIPGFVETSTNLASVKFKDGGKIEVVTSQRSSLDSGKDDIVNMVSSVFELAGAKVIHSDGYPGWAPNPDSEILRVAEASYKRLFKKEPVVRAIHAGLECGLFLEKYPYLDMISIGPTLRNVHSPDERIEIKTVEMWWKHLLDILLNAPEGK